VTDWICVRATFETAPDDWSVYADAFDRFGCPGSLQSDRPPEISGYLADVEGSTAQASGLRDELLALGATSVSIDKVPDEDWSELWKIHFKPRLIGERIWVRPTWEEAPAAEGQIEIVLDPGQAFGTGDHPTTRVCMRLMEKVDLHGRTGYDLGCGSGILAIAAKKLGIGQIWASDIDPLSVSVTRENMALNGVEFPVAEGAGFLDFTQDPGRAWPAEPAALETPPAFDIVLSNIISATLIRLAPEVREKVKPGGDWIASGIIEGNWPDVRAAAERTGFELLETVNEDEWVGAHFRRVTS
jgi:ribosomal protein L11 methyltransferase